MSTRFTVGITLFALLQSFVSIGYSKDSENSAPFESGGEGPIFFVDYANFQGLDDQTYLEFYFHMAYQDLQFFKNGKKFRAGYDLEFFILNESQEIIEQHHSTDVFDVETFAQTQSTQKARVSLLAYTLDAGTYIVKAIVTDRETQKSAKIEEYVRVQNFQSTELLISDIQLSQKIEPGEEGQPYVKNQRFIEPNPVRTFAHGLADIYVYFEVYNLMSPDLHDYTNYIAHFIIDDEDGKRFAQINRRHPKPGHTSAHSIKLPVDHFLNGKYSLTVRILDEDTNQTVETTKDFIVLDSPISMSNLNYEDYPK